MVIKEAYKTRVGSLGEEIYIKDPIVGGYTTYFVEFPNIIAEGNTIKEAQKNLWAATYDVLKYYTSSDI